MSNTYTILELFEQVENTLINYHADPELIDFIRSRIEMTNRKNARRSTELTVTQKENLELKSQVLSYIVENPNITCKMLTKHFGVSSQKLTPILSKLVLDEQVTFTTEKKVKYFTAC